MNTVRERRKGQTDKHGCRQTYRLSDKETDKHRGIQRGTETDEHRDIQRDIVTDKHRDIQR